MALSDVKCRNARPASKLAKLSDGGGLQLWVQPTGSRLWRLAYRFEGKQKLLALGSYPLISLAEARQARDDAKRLLLSGINPAQERSSRKAGSTKDTFRSIADEYVDKLKKEGRADRTISKVKWLLDFAYPSIGDKCIREIDPASILTHKPMGDDPKLPEAWQVIPRPEGKLYTDALSMWRRQTTSIEDETTKLEGASDA